MIGKFVCWGCRLGKGWKNLGVGTKRAADQDVKPVKTYHIDTK